MERIHAADDPTGFGPRRNRKRSQVNFDSNKNNYELWEVKFLGHLRIHAPIDEEMFLEDLKKQKQGRSYKLNKSLCGLKQSGRNCYQLLNDLLQQEKFMPNLCDHCVYRKQVKDDIIIVLLWWMISS